MTEPIHDPSYWKKRLEVAQTGHLHHSIFRCPLDRWQAIEAKHREILAKVVGDRDSVLDCGCGYGRLLTLMPVSWVGDYLGLDLSPDFVELAQQRHPGRSFQIADLLKINTPFKFDIAVMISVKPMVVRNQGQGVWNRMNEEIQDHSLKQLYLEYDPLDEGDLQTTD